MPNDFSDGSPFFRDMPSQTRIDLTLCCICAGMPVPLVKRQIARGCKLTPRMADYIVREAMTVWTGARNPFMVLRYQSLAWYQHQLMSPTCPLRLKFRARKEIDTLLGLYDRNAIKQEQEEEKAHHEDEKAKRAAERRAEVQAEVTRALYATLSTEQLKVIADVGRMIQEGVEAKLGAQPDVSSSDRKVVRRRNPRMVFKT